MTIVEIIEARSVAPVADASFKDEPAASLKSRLKFQNDTLTEFDDLAQAYFKKVCMDHEVTLGDLMYTCWDECLASEKHPDYPLVIQSNFDLLDPMLDLKAFVRDSLSIREDFAQFTLVHINCRPDDSFSSLIAQVLSAAGLSPEDRTFGESTISSLDTQLCGLVVCLRKSERLNAYAFERLLEYFRELTSTHQIAFLVDSAVVVDRLGAHMKFGLRFEPAKQLLSPDELFKELYVHLLNARFEYCLVAPEVAKDLCEQISANNIPLCTSIKILRYCTLSNLQHRPELLALLSEAELTAKLGCNPKSFIAALPDALRRTHELLVNNAVLLEVLAAVPNGRKRYDWIQDMLAEPNFGTKAILDQVYNSLHKLTPDEVVRVLKFIERKLETFSHKPTFAMQIKQEVCSRAEGWIRSPADISDAVDVLRQLIADAPLFHLGSFLAPCLIFEDERKELGQLFFPDLAKCTMLALKKPSHYTVKSANKGGCTSRRVSWPASPVNTPAIIPDTCRVYTLTLGWQRLVNLHGLYTQFQSQLRTGSKKPTAEEQRILMARFMQAISELELVGLLAPVGKRRDTYERKNLCDSLKEGFA